MNLNSISETLIIGQTFTLAVSLSPTNATNQNITCRSSNNNIAYGGINGLSCIVYANGVGKAWITVSSSDGKYSASCNITVIASPTAVNGVSLSSTNKTLTVGQSFILTSALTPSNATNQYIDWSSSNNRIVSISVSGSSCTVYANAPGSTNITVRSSDGNYSATCFVTVIELSVSVNGVSLSNTNKTLTVGESFVLTATITPSNATNQYVDWSSSNRSVATISGSGDEVAITANSAGNTEITVMTADRGYFETCYVVVSAPGISVTGVSLDKAHVILPLGSSITLTATIFPSNATNQELYWSTNCDYDNFINGDVIWAGYEKTVVITAPSSTNFLGEYMVYVGSRDGTNPTTNHAYCYISIVRP